MNKTAIYLSAAAVVASLAVAALCSCTRAQGDQALKLLTMSTTECVKVAQAQGKTDIAAYCQITDSALDIINALLADTSCALPATDAGHD